MLMNTLKEKAQLLASSYVHIILKSLLVNAEPILVAYCFFDPFRLINVAGNCGFCLGLAVTFSLTQVAKAMLLPYFL